jgi:hypothetical protein
LFGHFCLEKQSFVLLILGCLILIKMEAFVLDNKCEL